MQVNIKTIPHSEQRYDTCGDYWVDSEGIWQIRVSDMGNWRYEMAVALHELWEKSLCEARGIKDEAITGFDQEFESRRKEGNIDEPGDDPEAPYANEHCSATGIERLFIAVNDDDWKDYENTINNL